VDTLGLSPEVFLMPKTRPPYSPEFRRQIYNLAAFPAEAAKHHPQLASHLELFLHAYNHARRLKTLKGLMPADSSIKSGRKNANASGLTYYTTLQGRIPNWNLNDYVIIVE
jgi:hypothetical protein